MTLLVAAEFSEAQWAMWWPLLHEALPGETLVRDAQGARASEVEIALVANAAPGSLSGLPGLRLVQSLWAGVDRLLADASVPADVPLARMVDPEMSATMAQTALWAVLSVHRAFFDYADRQREASWHPLPLKRAADVVVAVLGLGQMGRSSARRIADGGYRVIGWRSSPVASSAVASRADDVGIDVFGGPGALEGVLAQADIVINLLPLTPDTRGLFAAATFARMKSSASLVNLGRGGHVVESDLLDALDRGRLRRAVLDVFATEPLPPTHPFWAHPKITILPHVAAETDPRSAARIAARNVRALREGRPIEHLVDRTRGY